MYFWLICFIEWYSTYCKLQHPLHYWKKTKWSWIQLEITSAKLLKWFRENGMKANQKNLFSLQFWHNSKILLNWLLSNSENLLRVTIDIKVNFKEHVTNLCNKASKKIQALARVFPHMPETQKKLLMNAYFLSQIVHCLLVWMNYSKVLIYKCINRLHERALSIKRDFSLTFSEALIKDK